jgi:hypothetical protein
MSYLGDCFHTQRKCQLPTLGQLAQRLGYRNVSKGARKLLHFEREGVIKPDLLVKVAEALGIDWGIVERIMEEERQEKLQAWEAWVSEPVPMRLVVRLMAAVYRGETVPEEIKTKEEAEKWACDWASKHQRQVCLVLSRRSSTWIDADGCVTGRTEAKPDEPNAPYMQIGNHSFLLNDGGCREARA